MKKVYMSFSTDVIHGGHVDIIQKASEIGELTVGVLSDEAVASYKRFPILSFEERCKIISGIVGVTEVIPQYTLSYADNLRNVRPDYVVHGDDWKEGPQTAIREEVISVLKEIGGELIEYRYSAKDEYARLEERSKERISTAEFRRGRLRKIMNIKRLVTAIEAHSGLTGLIAEKTTYSEKGTIRQFDAMWVSSLCDSTARGKPDIELVDISSRLRTVDEIMDVTTKPIIMDGDTGGLIEHFVHNIRTLERIGVSAVVIEDKVGLKKNSLFGTDVQQTQDTIENFCAKISAGKSALRTKDFMLFARIESLILDMGIDDAFERAIAYCKSGADGIVIHSRKKDAEEIIEFCDRFRSVNKTTPLIVIPTTFNTVTESELEEHGVNLVIYANHLTRSAFPSMRTAAELILKHRRAKEADDLCMSIKDILTLIPGDL